MEAATPVVSLLRQATTSRNDIPGPIPYLRQHSRRRRQRCAVEAMDHQKAAVTISSSFVPAGEKSLSKENKLWGGRFEESVTDAVERFSESVSFDKALYKQDIRGSRAHASMLAAQVTLQAHSFSGSLKLLSFESVK